MGMLNTLSKEVLMQAEEVEKNKTELEEIAETSGAAKSGTFLKRRDVLPSSATPK